MVHAVIAVQPQDLSSALAAIGVAGEDAAAEANGPGTFHALLYDALYALTPERLDARANIDLA